MRRWQLGVGAALALLGSLVVLVGSMAARGGLVLHQCVAGDPTLLRLGVRLALLQPSPDCATGLALGTPAGVATPLVVTVAVPALLAQLGAVAVALGLAARARDLLRRFGATVFGRRLPAEPEPVAAVVGAPVAAPAPEPVGTRAPRTVRHRGPPAAQPALAF